MKRKNIRAAALIILLLVVAAAIVGYRMYNKPHRSAAAETAMPVSAADLATAYETDEAAADKKFLGKVLQVSGTVSELSVNQQQQTVLMLHGSDMAGVQCTLEKKTEAVKKGDHIAVKGFCNGFLTDVVIDRCIVQ